MIVIVGDHTIKDKRIKSFHDKWVPFIIINSPLQQYSGRPISQIDIFPTILDIFGKEYRFLEIDYTGLGESIFRNIDSDSPVELTQEDYGISEKIIRSKLP